MTRYAAFMVLLIAGCASAAASTPDVILYSKAGCPYCAAAQEFLVESRRAGREFSFEVHDVAKDDNAYEAFMALVRTHGLERAAVPLMVVDGVVIVGFRDPETPERLAELLGWKASTDRPAEIPAGLPAWLSPTRAGLPLFTIALGLTDGFNPCAMWMLMFLLTMLVHVRSRPRMFLIAGIFVLTSGVIYFLFMAAWLNLFLAFRWSTPLRLIIGGLGLTAAMFHLKDSLTGFAGPSLSISGERKNRIARRVRDIITADNLPLALGAVITLAVLVNFYELLCTAGLPAIYTQVLANQAIEGWRFYAYLALYNLAYVLDDGIMVFAATWALASRRLDTGGGRVLKGVSGLVLLTLSLLIIWRPQWLSFTS